MVFKVHHPFYLRTYRFFDIGQRHNYYDDYRNKYILKRFSERSYAKANALMQQCCDRYGDKFKVAFVFTGSAVDQMQWYMPGLLDDFEKLISRPNVELLATDYSGSAVSVMDLELWKRQVEYHKKRMREVFGKTCKVVAGTQLLYDDKIGQAAFEMGFKGMLTEGAKPVLGWKSPHVLYRHPDHDLRLILRDGVWSENISLRFSDRSNPEWPYTVEGLLESISADRDRLSTGSHLTLYCDYAVMGEFQEEGSGIFRFFEALPETVLGKSDYVFAHPSDLCKFKEEVPMLHVPFTVSDMDEEKDLTAFYANELQKDVMDNWKRVCAAMQFCKDPELIKDFRFLTGVEKLGFMSTKYFTDTPSIRYLNPYDSPYDAYINYMNVWSDFLGRLKEKGLIGPEGQPEVSILEEWREPVQKAVETLRKKAKEAASKVKKEDVRTYTRQMVDTTAEAVETVQNAVKKAGKTTVSRVKEWVKNEDLEETARKGLGFLKNMIEEVKTAAGNTGEKRSAAAAKASGSKRAASKAESGAKTASARSAAARKTDAKKTATRKAASAAKTTVAKKTAAAKTTAAKVTKTEAKAKPAAARKTAAKGKKTVSDKKVVAKTAVAKNGK